MICRFDEAACPLDKEKGFWCLRADFTNAFLVLSNVKQAQHGKAFPLRAVLDAVLTCLRVPTSYAATSVPWPEHDPPMADFAAAFGRDCESDEEPELPPRMAYELMHGAAYLGDTLHGDWSWRSFGMFVHLPRTARWYLRNSGSWRKSLQQCYFRIYTRLRMGQMPKPNCTGEEMALHTLFDYVEEDEHPDWRFGSDDEYWDLPQFPNDENYSDAKECCLQDYDVLDLYEDEDSDGETSSEDAEDVENSHGPGTSRTLEWMQSPLAQRPFHFAHLHPREWFEAFDPKVFWAEVA